MVQYAGKFYDCGKVLPSLPFNMGEMTESGGNCPW